MHIRFARNAEEVRASLRSFNEEARRDAKRVRALVAQSYRCVYDPQERASGVARFVA